MNKTPNYIQIQSELPPGISPINVLNEIRYGQAVRALEKKEEGGEIRGGSCGVILGKQIIGECHRKAHLRFLGGDSILGEETELMTRKGEVVEDIVLADLQAGGWEMEDAKTIDLGWKLNQVSGRGSMDILMKRPGAKFATMGLELKDINSMHVMRAKHYQLNPDPKHVIQAANYAIRYGDYRGLKDKDGKSIPLPYAILYTFRSVMHTQGLPDYIMEDIRKQGMLDVEFNDNGWPKAVQPFYRIYYIGWTFNGQATYWTAGMKEPQVTGITRETLDKYYSAVSTDIAATGNLGPRPSNKDLCGNTTFRQCDYCDLAPICNEYEGDYAQWRDRAMVYLKEKRKARWVIKETLGTTVVNAPMVTAATTDVETVAAGTAEVMAVATRMVETHKVEMEILADKPVAQSEPSSLPKTTKASSKGTGAAKISKRK